MSTVEYRKKQRRGMSSKVYIEDVLAPQIQEFLLSYVDKLGRCWPDVKTTGTHASSLCYNDVRRWLGHRDVPFVDSDFRKALRLAFTRLAEQQARIDALVAAAPVPTPGDGWLNVDQVRKRLQNGNVGVFRSDDSLLAIEELVPGHLVIALLVYADSPQSQLRHPALLHRVARKFEFKHSSHDGHKWWTERSGIEMVVAVPFDRIWVADRSGCTYPKVWINGVEVTLNGSGDCDLEVTGIVAETCIGYDEDVLRAVCDAAVTADSEVGQVARAATAARWYA